jgi:hypothetical protein
MSITLDDLSMIINLNNISLQINRYVPIVLLVFGMIGNLISCCVFVQRTLRSNPCSIYFLAASLSNLIFLKTLLSPMLGAWSEAFNLINTISALCKFTMFVILTARTLALWFIVLATIDRYLVSSSETIRHRMRNSKQAYRWSIIVCVISILIWAETTYYFDANLIDAPIKCYTHSDTCRLYNDIILALITITIPSLVMLIFSLLTIVHIRQSRLRTYPGINTVTVFNEKHRRNERMLPRMLLTQVFLMIILNLPHAIYILYLTITFYQPKTPVQGTINSFIFNTLLLLPFLSSCISFLIYTLSGKLFRETLVQLWKNIIRHLNSNN